MHRTDRLRPLMRSARALALVPFLFVVLASGCAERNEPAATLEEAAEEVRDETGDFVDEVEDEIDDHS